MKKHQDIFKYGILSKYETTYILTYTLDSLEENLFSITGEEDYIIIHVLTNDIKYICYNQRWKSVSERKNDLIYLAYNFTTTIKTLIAKYPNVKIIIDMILPRFDEKDLLEMGSRGNEITNVEISKHLLGVKNVILIEVGNMEETDFVDDKIHLSKGGFKKICLKWRAAISEYCF